jgi:hypothetical protein
MAFAKSGVWVSSVLHLTHSGTMWLTQVHSPATRGTCDVPKIWRATDIAARTVLAVAGKMKTCGACFGSLDLFSVAVTSFGPVLSASRPN